MVLYVNGTYIGPARRLKCGGTISYSWYPKSLRGNLILCRLSEEMGMVRILSVDQVVVWNSWQGTEITSGLSTAPCNRGFALVQ